MKQKVVFSAYSRAVTFVVTVALFIGLAVSYGEPAVFFSLLAIVVPLYTVCLFFAPVSISADKNGIHIHSLFKIRTICMSDVRSVERYRPLPGTIRTCASDGFMGYWGTFRDRAIKDYTGYWGKNDDCFLVTLANGKKYLLGCEKPDVMVDYIESQILVAA